MRAVLLLGLVLVASGAAGTVPLVQPANVLGYHEAVGIPEAARIKAFEDQQFAAVSAACGSSLVTSNRLVTAAHCWFDGNFQASQFTVVLGSHLLFSGGIRIVTNQVIMHPAGNPATLANDIAMIYLPFNAPLTAAIQPVALPSTTQLGNQFVGQWAVAAGYGMTSDLRDSDTHLGCIYSRVYNWSGGVVAPTVLERFKSKVYTKLGFWALHSNICTSGAGSVGISGGDSGGPLTVNSNGQNILVGISSFIAWAGCQAGYPSAFTRVTSFHNFIVSHL